MRSISRNMFTAIVGLAVLSILVTACASGSEATEVPAAEIAEHMDEAEHMEEAEHMDEGEHMEEGEHMDGDEHMDDEHMEEGEHMDQHGVPEDAAAVPNPIAADDESRAFGAETYAANCAVCHGDTGEGDGPAAAGLEKPPADLHEGHVQELTDGALFHIITHGRADTPMPAWKDVLTEDQRWHVVNFLRTFQ